MKIHIESSSYQFNENSIEKQNLSFNQRTKDSFSIDESSWLTSSNWWVLKENRATSMFFFWTSVFLVNLHKSSSIDSIYSFTSVRFHFSLIVDQFEYQIFYIRTFISHFGQSTLYILSLVKIIQTISVISLRHHADLRRFNNFTLFSTSRSIFVEYSSSLSFDYSIDNFSKTFRISVFYFTISSSSIIFTW